MMELTREKNKLESWMSVKITGISLPVYLILLLVLILALSVDKLPHNILGALAVLVLLGNLFHFLGTKIPIVKTYLGGGAVFCIFASAAIATFHILPDSAVDLTKDFVNHMGFLDFYIAALITGSILGMNRDLLVKAAVRFIPVALLSMVSCFFAVGLVGMLLGNGFKESVMYVAFPAMAGGIGAGVVPLSSIYAGSLHTSSAAVISRLIPASALCNVLAIIFAAMTSKIGENFPKQNGHGILMKIDVDLNQPAPKLDIAKMGVGLALSIAFFLSGSILNYFVPKVHAYAFMIIVVFICKAFNFIPSYYQESAVMFNQLIVKI